MFYTGIDLHKDNSFLTTINDSGGVVKQQRVPNDVKLLEEYFQSLGTEHRAVVESTMSWYWISDLLESQGIEVSLAHAKYLKAISYAKVKTDKVDSHTLAQLLRMGLIPSAHKIRGEVRAQRDTLRARLHLVGKRTSCYNSIHRIAEKFNCDEAIIRGEHVLPSVLPDLYQMQVQCYYAQIDLLTHQIKQVEQSLRTELLSHNDVQRLLWVPAIGIHTALTIYLETDGIERFADEKKYFSYSRLVPGAANSNRTQRQKSGCKDGNKYLKIAFTDAAIHAVRYYPEFRSYYQKMRRRTNEAIARTLVAKELARIVYHILQKKTEYKGFKGQAPSRVKSLSWPRLTSPDLRLVPEVPRG